VERIPLDSRTQKQFSLSGPDSPTLPKGEWNQFARRITCLASLKVGSRKPRSRNQDRGRKSTTVSTSSTLVSPLTLR